jgi:primary-amine oxidase
LVVRSASEVGNYDYLIDYVFQQDGMIHVLVGATGLDAVKGVAATSMADATARADAIWHANRTEPRGPEP